MPTRPIPTSDSAPAKAATWLPGPTCVDPSRCHRCATWRLRRALFHNGRFKTLNDAVDFYARRDTRPDLFYPALPDGSVDRYNDLPLPYKANVSRGEAPYNRVPGGVPAMSAAEVNDIVAFLETLTDGWTP